MILERAVRACVMAVKSTGYAWILLACGVVASFALFFIVQHRVEGVAKLRFESEVRVASSRIQNRMRTYGNILYGVRALFQATGLVSRREFHDYVDSLNLGARYPGFQTLNFEQYVTAERKAAFEASVRLDRSLNGRGYPGFRIRPPDERPAYHVLTYLEPMEGNEGVFGNDIAMNNYPINLRLFERVRDTNDLFSSGRLVRIEGPERYVALAMRLPVYRVGMPINSAQERRDAYIGSVGAGFRVRESLDPIIATAIPKPIKFKLYNIGPAGTAVTPDRLVEGNLLYSNHTGNSGSVNSFSSDGGTSFLAVQGFQFGRRELVIHFSTSPIAYMEPLARWASVFTLSGGLIITLLLSALVYSLGRSRHEAQLLAAEMTGELQESKAFLDEAQRVARIGSWMLDLTTNETRWSAETYRIFGVSAGTPLIHEAFRQHVHPEDRDAVDRAWKAALKGERYDIEYRVLVGAAIRWVHEHANLEFAPDETQRRSVGTVQDVTERKRAEELLRESEQELRAIFEGALDGILVADTESRNLLAANSAICRMLGYTREEIVRIGISDIHPKQDLPRAMEQFERQRRGEIGMAVNIPMMRKDGSAFYADIKGSRICFGGTNCMLGVIRDVTERKQAEKALRESEDRLHQAYQERERLAQDLHDGIVQAIYAVGLGLEQVQRQITEDAEEARKNLSGAIIRLNAVIREVRNHIVGLQREELNWMRLLTELHDILHSVKATRGVQFSLDAAPIVLARLSAGMAHEVLNIVREAVSNSLRHSGGKRGMVSLSERDGRVLLAIEDDGAGFDVLKQRGQGQGLRNIAARAQALAAQFDIRSRPGHGTRIVVDIPLQPEHVRG